MTATRRTIAGFIAAAFAAPRAVKAQALEALGPDLLDSVRTASNRGGGGLDAPGLIAANRGRLNPLQLASKLAAEEASLAARRRIARISRCRSLSPAAMEAYTRRANAEGDGLWKKFHDLMGWD